MNNLDKQYCDLLQHILNNGVDKSDRTGTGTRAVFGTSLRHKMSEGFPLLTTKKVFWKGVVHELLWMIKGETNIKPLVDVGVNIWVGDCYKNFQRLYHSKFVQGYDMMDEKTFIQYIKEDAEFAATYGELGPVYGKQWREIYSPYYDAWSINMGFVENGKIDQLQNVINTLKTNPDDRRMIVNAWNPAQIQDMVLPPCHYSFQFFSHEMTVQERGKWVKDNGGTTEDMSISAATEQEFQESMKKIELVCERYNAPKRYLSLIWNQRSVDSFLGLPFNIASYGLLLSMVAKVVNMEPYELIFYGGDTHLYNNHFDAAREQIRRADKAYELPALSFKEDSYVSIDDFTYEDIILENYLSHDTIKAKLSN
jgi:thymidylate synthase